jgi:hypothetical protein
VGVLGEEVVGAGVEVGEVGAAAAGDEDLLADALGVVKQEDAAAATASGGGTHEAGGASSENENIKVRGGAVGHAGGTFSPSPGEALKSRKKVL